MSDYNYTVGEFIKLTPPQKSRLMQRDPEQYELLRRQMEKNFSKETDHEILQSMGKERE